MASVRDIARGRDDFVTDGREDAALLACAATWSPREIEAIEPVATTMWEPYIQATNEAIPLACSKIVYDRFHVTKHMTEKMFVVA